MLYRVLSRVLRFILTLIALAFSVIAQTTVSTGSIQGTVSDPTNAAVRDAKIAITNKATDQAFATTTNSSGIYSSGGLIPGDYQVRVEHDGFAAASLAVSVRVGGTANGDVSLVIGKSSEVLEVTSTANTVNRDQVTVQGVLSAAQIDQLPINGRNFLDLAQLEPGVQIQDGINFDPSKVGYSSISFGGRFGRTARIYVDGVDITDETAGTTTQDIPSSGIQEFQLSQSNLDLSNDLTSSGAVNVVTRSGSNDFHGELFYLIRDSRWSAQLSQPLALTAPYQRNQFGGRLGGRIIKNKLFFFLDYERTKQDESVPVPYAAPFQAFSGTYVSPFRENETMGRMDWQVTGNLRLFYRFNYSATLAESAFFPSSFQVYKSKSYPHNHVAGADFNTGQFTHTIRFSELRFEDNIADAVVGTSLPLANLGINLSVINGPQTGPNWLAPQAFGQRDRQLRYDGGKQMGAHFLRYGVNYNHIEAGGFASFSKIAPQIYTNLSPDDISFAAAGPYSGGASNPLNYPVEVVILGNGQGYFTEKPGLGFPAGLLGPDNRFAVYLGDSWRIHRNLMLTYGLRYVRDTGRTDSDLPPFPQLNVLLPGIGGRVNQPDFNLAPQAGIAWNPDGKGKTVYRVGAGLFFENAIFNNVAFDRPLRVPSGAFAATPTVCGFGEALPASVPNGTILIPSALCNERIGQAAASIAAFQGRYQAQVPFSLATPNPNYLVTQLGQGVNLPLGLFAPDYKTPSSLQMNAGFQRELRPGMVLTVDYLRNITTHTLLGIDANHVGDVSYFSKVAAKAAISATLGEFGTASIDQAVAKGATIANFARNGLTSPGLDFGGACPFDYGCAFSGINPKAPEIPLQYPIGRSVYNALHLKLAGDVKMSLPGIRRINFQTSYSLASFVNSGGTNPTYPGYYGANDQDFVNNAIDNAHPLSRIGPSLLDRTHQLSFGAVVDLIHSFRAAIMGHFYSGLPLSLIVPVTGSGAGEIFRTDFTGDGTVADLLPGTKVGDFNRGISAAGLAAAIQRYNNTVANQPTPAGQVLIANGLFTLAQLQALGGVAPTIPAPPAGQVGVSSLRAFDLKLSWNRKFGERLEIEPNVGFYNVFNFANWDLPPNILSGLLTGAPGSVNGTTQADRVINRVGLGTGVFALGAPRSIEFGTRIAF
jgi:hypothetical protein